jgi:pyridoxine 5-phosphate synthase
MANCFGNNDMTKLSVNLNKVALLRNQRDIGYPSVLEAARMAIRGGAQGITVHPRPDERHIRRSDVRELAEDYGGRVEYNIEGYPSPDWLALVAEVRPDQATLVPDAPDAHTSDHGWDIPAHRAFLAEVLGGLKAEGARVSLFVDADPAVVPHAQAVGVDRVELYTGPYGMAFGTVAEEAEFGRLVATARAVRAAGLALNAGHDLNLDNLPRLIAAAPWIAEVSIGHAVTADALRWGFETAAAKYLQALTPAFTTVAAF